MKLRIIATIGLALALGAGIAHAQPPTIVLRNGVGGYTVYPPNHGPPTIIMRNGNGYFIYLPRERPYYSAAPRPEEPSAVSPPQERPQHAEPEPEQPSQPGVDSDFGFNGDFN